MAATAGDEYRRYFGRIRSSFLIVTLLYLEYGVYVRAEVSRQFEGEIERGIVVAPFDRHDGPPGNPDGVGELLLGDPPLGPEDVQPVYDVQF